MIIPIKNYYPVNIMQPKIYIPSPTLNNYNYYNKINQMSSNNNYANYINNNNHIVYNTINNYSTANNIIINNSYLTKRIIIPNPINYSKFITYNK